LTKLMQKNLADGNSASIGGRINGNG